MDFMGKSMGDWIDIYYIKKFRGEDPKSLKDLYGWAPAHTPEQCLKLAFELIEARKKFNDQENPVADWICDFMRGGGADHDTDI